MKQSIHAKLFSAGLVVLVVQIFFGLSLGFSQEKKEAWTAEDTQLANQYVRLLEVRPEYSKVLDLLWKHYASHDATELLMTHYREASGAPEARVQVRLVYAHLLRKKGALDEALALYRELEDDPEVRPIVLLGLSEVLRELQPDGLASERYLRKLANEGGAGDEALRASLMSLAEKYFKTGDVDGAIRVWRDLAEKNAHDLGLLQELAAKMINAGHLEEAIAVYESLRNVEDMEKRVGVLAELGRLYELAKDFERAHAALNEGREVTHFKHHTHLAFLSMLVRLFEREGRLDELEDEFVEEAAGDRPTEEALFTLVRFYEMTAWPLKREGWLRKLVGVAPGRPEYREELVEVLLSNDHYEEAKALLEGLAMGSAEENLNLRLLRVRIELNLEGQAAGTKLLETFLAEHDLTAQETVDVLRFAEEHYLDDVVERLLLASAEAEGDEAIFRLAKLHFSRGRLTKARRVLEAHVEEASGEPQRRAERLAKVSLALQSMHLTDAALAALKEAVALDPNDRDLHIRLAEIHADADRTEEAMESYELAWQVSERDEDRVDVDQRIYSLLQLSDLQTGDGGRSAGAPPSGPRNLVPGTVRFKQLPGVLAKRGVQLGEGELLLTYYLALRKAAFEQATPETQLRAAWWANQMEDYASAFELLTAYREANPGRLKAERLLLEVAESSKQISLALRQLELLSKLDESRKVEYELRRAQLRIEHSGESFREEALTDLEKIAEADSIDSRVLKKLAAVYEGLGRPDAALEIYRRAFFMSTLHEKRQLIVELTRLQVKSGDYDGALEAMTGLIQEERDILQRRKQLANQVNIAIQHQRLAKLEKDYGALQREFPLRPFYSEALALVYEKAGKRNEAFSAIKKAYYGSRTKDGHLLERMRHLAAETRDVRAAIYYQKQLVAVPDNRADVDEWEKLIRMLEMNFQVQEADRIRLRLERKFSQDPEVLRELADYYLKERQPSAARRVLARMVRLRPWHVPSLLSLGILEKEAGNRAKAAEMFFEILKHTEDIAGEVVAPTGIERFPLRQFSRGGRPELTNEKKSLERLVRSLDDYRLIDNRLRMQVAHYLESGRPEFLVIPDKRGMQRLRAIEELGELQSISQESNLTGQWESYWEENPSTSREEVLWVASCGGDEELTWEILNEELSGKRTALEEFVYCLYGVKLNRIPHLVDWVRESDLTSGERNRRLTWLYAAIYHFAVEPGVRLPENDLLTLIESELTTSLHLYSLLDLLHKARRSDEALRIGELAAFRSWFSPGYIEYALASYAHGAGAKAKRRYYLEKVLAQVDPASPRFQDAGLKLYGLCESDERREELLEWVLSRLANLKERPGAAFGRARLLARAGIDEGAEAALRDVVTIHLTEAKANASFGIRGTLDASSLWASLFEYAHSARRLGLAEAARKPFGEARERYALVAPRAEESASRYQDFQRFLFQQLIWEFDRLPYRARRARIQSYGSFFRGRSDWQNLARTLSGEGYEWDAVPIYKELLFANPLENEYSRAFLDACEQARDFEPALEYLNLLLGQKMRAPEGASGQHLQQKHALFLEMAGRTERLKLFAEEQLKEDLGPEDRYYHHHLASLLRKSGRLEEAARVYAEIDDGKHHFPPLLRKHAAVLQELGREKAAIALLERIDFGNHGSAGDHAILNDLARLYASAGQGEKLRRLALNGLALGDEKFIISLADELLGVELEREAESTLLLALRRTKSDASRLKLLVPAMQIAFRSRSFDRIEPYLEIFFECDHSSSLEELRGFTKILRGEMKSSMGKALRAFLSKQEKKGKNGTFARVCLLEIKLGAGVASAELIDDVTRLAESNSTRDELFVAVETCLENDAGGLAERILDVVIRRTPQTIEYAPLAIRVYAALGNSAALAAFFQDLTREPYRSFISAERFVAVAQAFKEVGEGGRAARFCRHFYEQIPDPGSEHREMIDWYVQLLIEQGEFLEAGAVLRRTLRRQMAVDPALVVKVYDEWGRLDRLEDELGRFDVSSGVSRAIELLAEQRREEKEALSESTNQG